MARGRDGWREGEIESEGVGGEGERGSESERGRGPGPQEARGARRSEHLPEAHTSIVTDEEHLDDLRSMAQLGWISIISTWGAAVWPYVRGRGRGRALGCERALSHAAPSVRRGLPPVLGAPLRCRSRSRLRA